MSKLCSGPGMRSTSEVRRNRVKSAHFFWLCCGFEVPVHVAHKLTSDCIRWGHADWISLLVFTCGSIVPPLCPLVSSSIRLCTISSIVVTMRANSTEPFSWRSCFARQSALKMIASSSSGSPCLLDLRFLIWTQEIASSHNCLSDPLNFCILPFHFQSAVCLFSGRRICLPPRSVGSGNIQQFLIHITPFFPQFPGDFFFHLLEFPLQFPGDFFFPLPVDSLTSTSWSLCFSVFSTPPPPWLAKQASRTPIHRSQWSTCFRWLALLHPLRSLA